MKIIFAGTPAVAVPALETLFHSTHQIIAVITQPDRPQGRGKKIAPCPVKTFAKQHNIPVEQPDHFKDSALLERLKNEAPDLMIVMAYGLILPKSVLNLPRYGCINIHVSLLPRWRGASPVQQAILHGDLETGITLMQMDAGLDTGPMLAQTSCKLEPHDTSESVYAKLNQALPDFLLATLEKIPDAIQPKPQRHSDASYAPKIEKHDTEINWQDSSEMTDRKVRAYYPSPLTYFHWQGENIRVWQGKIYPWTTSWNTGEIIKIDKEGLWMKTKDGAYCITCLQFSGKNPLRGHEIKNAWMQKFKTSLKS